MRRPPAEVVFVARTHGFVGLVILAALPLLHGVTRDLPAIEFGVRTYAYAGALGGFYLLTAGLVWWGVPVGAVFSRLCGLLYLPRPAFWSRVWETMGTPGYRAHFQRR